jgi:hypothetical protein
VFRGRAASVTVDFSDPQHRHTLADSGFLCVRTASADAPSSASVAVLALQDYADSHSGYFKELWQHFAAASAAACLRSLLDAKTAIRWVASFDPSCFLSTVICRAAIGSHDQLFTIGAVTSNADEFAAVRACADAIFTGTAISEECLSVFALRP